MEADESGKEENSCLEFCDAGSGCLVYFGKVLKGGDN